MAEEPTPAPSDPPADPPVDPPADPPKAKANGAGDPPADDWRAVIQDEKLRKHAVNFTSIEHLAGSHFNLRKDLSTAITPLGKKPTDEQVTAYRKAINAPETAEGYEFTVPEGYELTDADKAFRAWASTTFHGIKLPAGDAKILGDAWNEYAGLVQKTKTDEDAAYAKESEDALKVEWPGEEFARNKAFADRAAAKLFGDSFEEVRMIEDKAGKFVLDNPAFVRMLAGVGREMEEGTLGGVMTESERMSVNENATEIRKKAQEAHARGDFGEADRLSEQERELYERRDGNQPIVGVDGRTA